MPDTVIAGRYRLLEKLGRGAMSSVWLADDEELGRKVAVKTLIPSADPARFEREARAAAALSHPNICGLYDYGAVDGKPFMVLEYLPNGSLEERLSDRTALAEDETLRIATEIAAGLAHAHGRDLIHRDLKPANVLFDTEGRAKIADFGIARMGSQGTLTEAGTVLGTASYISPEQAAGRPARPASDVYSFGVILFRMLTGRLPFVSTNAMELVRMHRDDPPPTVSDFRTDAPPRLAALADAALAKDPADRPADGAALFHALRTSDEGAATIVSAAAPVAAGDPAGATQVIRARRRGRSGDGRGRNRLPLAALVLLLLGGGGALALITNRGGGARAPVRTTVPGLSLPTVGTVGSTSGTSPTTTAPTASAHPTTTAPTTTRATPMTTTAPTTTPATTAPTTTAVPVTTVVPSTTVSMPSTTTAATTTTTATTTDTTPTTTTAP
ncbi:MAG: serine/threonine protein kinase [Actinobacteria bacterium]|nr:serine/threonine protein kinase [Actinomycetota bacterium]